MSSGRRLRVMIASESRASERIVTAFPSGASATVAPPSASRRSPAGTRESASRTCKSDDSGRFQLCELALGFAEQAAIDLVVVLAEQGRRDAVLDRRPGEPHRARNDWCCAARRMRDVDAQLAMLHLRIFEHLLHVVDRPAWHRRFLKRCDPFL